MRGGGGAEAGRTVVFETLVEGSTGIAALGCSRWHCEAVELCAWSERIASDLARRLKWNLDFSSICTSADSIPPGSDLHRFMFDIPHHYNFKLLRTTPNNYVAAGTVCSDQDGYWQERSDEEGEAGEGQRRNE